MHRRMLLSAVGTNNSIDLELEGSLSGITTIAQLATFLGVAVSKISYWETTGTLIKIAFKGNYKIPAGRFYNNTILTKLRDVGGVVIEVDNNGLRNTALTELYLPKTTTTQNASIAYNTNLTVIDLPLLVNYGDQTLRGNTATTHIYLINIEKIKEGLTLSNDFQGLSSLELLDMRKLKVYGLPSAGYGGTTSGLGLIKLGCEIRVHIALATCNAGAVNEALRYAKNFRGAIVKFYDDDGNYVSTL